MNFESIKETKTLYPRKIKFKPMVVGLGVGLGLALGGCASNQPDSMTHKIESKNVSIDVPKEHNITEPEFTAGIPLMPEAPKKQ